MFDTASLATFTVATTLLLVTPGPAVLFVVARSLEQGRTAGMVLIVGLIFTGLAVVSDSVYALLAGTARHLFSGSVAAARTQKYLAGVTYVVLGITTALSGSGRSK